MSSKRLVARVHPFDRVIGFEDGGEVFSLRRRGSGSDHQTQRAFNASGRRSNAWRTARLWNGSDGAAACGAGSRVAMTNRRGRDCAGVTVGVGLNGAEAVAEFGKRGDQHGEVGAPGGGQKTRHVFDDDGARRAAFAIQRFDEAPETPEGRRAAPVQPAAIARQTQVLTGRRRPGEVGAARQVGGLQLPDVARTQMAVAEVFGVGSGLQRVEIVGEGAVPCRAQAKPAMLPPRRRTRRSAAAGPCFDLRRVGAAPHDRREPIASSAVIELDPPGEAASDARSRREPYGLAYAGRLPEVQSRAQAPRRPQRGPTLAVSAPASAPGEVAASTWPTI